MHRATNENKTGKRNPGPGRAFLPSSLLRAGSRAAGRLARHPRRLGPGEEGSVLDASDPSACPLRLPGLFKAGCRRGSGTAFLMQITRVNGQIPRWALEGNAELLAAGRGPGEGVLYLQVSVRSNLTATAAKGDTRDLLSSSALPAACQGHGQGAGKGEGRGEAPRQSLRAGSRGRGLKRPKAGLTPSLPATSSALPR